VRLGIGGARQNVRRQRCNPARLGNTRGSAQAREEPKRNGKNNTRVTLRVERPAGGGERRCCGINSADEPPNAGSPAPHRPAICQTQSGDYYRGLRPSSSTSGASIRSKPVHRDPSKSRQCVMRGRRKSMSGSNAISTYNGPGRSEEPGSPAKKNKATFPIQSVSRPARSGSGSRCFARVTLPCVAAGGGGQAAAQTRRAALLHSERARLLVEGRSRPRGRAKELQEARSDEGGSWVGESNVRDGTAPVFNRAAAADADKVTGEILPSDHGKLAWSGASRSVCRIPSSRHGISRDPFVARLATRSPWQRVVLKRVEEDAERADCSPSARGSGITQGVFKRRDALDPQSRRRVGERRVIATGPFAGVSFTGSTPWALRSRRGPAACEESEASSSARKDALIVLDDAEIEHARHAATFGSFMPQGQICMSGACDRPRSRGQGIHDKVVATRRS